MRKLFFLMLVLIASVTTSAQGIYTHITKYDKFDDVEWKEDIKTLITKTENTFVIETKGSEPETYVYFEVPYLSTHIGRRDSLVNLVTDVWGYESQYKIIPQNRFEELFSELEKRGVMDLLNTTEETETFQETLSLILMGVLLEMDLPTIVIRNVSKFRYTYEYSAEYFWIQYSDGSRVIYSKNVY